MADTFLQENKEGLKTVDVEGWDMAMLKVVESPIFHFYNFDESSQRSKCSVNGCTVSLKGKHISNLQRHLQNIHTDKYVQFKLMLEEQENQIQNYFEYDKKIKKSKCIGCGIVVRGKQPLALRKHINKHRKPKEFQESSPGDLDIIDLDTSSNLNGNMEMDSPQTKMHLKEEEKVAYRKKVLSTLQELGVNVGGVTFSEPLKSSPTSLPPGTVLVVSEPSTLRIIHRLSKPLTTVEDHIVGPMPRLIPINTNKNQSFFPKSSQSSTIPTDFENEVPGSRAPPKLVYQKRFYPFEQEKMEVAWPPTEIFSNITNTPATIAPILEDVTEEPTKFLLPKQTCSDYFAFRKQQRERIKLANTQKLPSSVPVTENNSTTSDSFLKLSSQQGNGKDVAPANTILTTKDLKDESTNVEVAGQPVLSPRPPKLRLIVQGNVENQTVSTAVLRKPPVLFSSISEV